MLRPVIPTVALSLLLAALLPAAGASPIVAQLAQDTAGATVLTVHIPLPDGELPDDGHYEVPTADGLLVLDLQPITLPGPGGTVDVGAYLAEAKMLIDGNLESLPSLLVIPEEETIEGQAAQAMADLQVQIEALQSDLQSLSDELGGQSDAAQAEILAAIAQADWIGAMAQEATGVASDGLASQLAILNALLAHIESALPLLQSFMDGVNSTLAWATPEVPDKVWIWMGKANETLNATILSAEAARDSLVAQAGETAATVDALVKEQQAFIDGAIIALQAAYDSLTAPDDSGGGDDEPEEPSRLDKMQAEAERRAANQASGAQDKVDDLQASVDEQKERSSEEFQATVEMAETALDETIAPLKWALAWSDEARQYADEDTKRILDDANMSIAQATKSSEDMRAIVEKYYDQKVDPVVDEQLGDSDSVLDQAAAAIAQAQSDLAAVQQQLLDLAGGLNPPEDDDEPAEPPQDETFAVCIDQPTSIACAEYEQPASGPGELVLVIMIPNVAGLVPNLPPTPGTSGPVATIPAPGTVVAPITSPITSITLPGEPSVTPPTTSSAAPSSNPAPTSSTRGSFVPGIGIQPKPDSLDLVEGEQGVIDVVVKNTGNARDTYRLAIDSDAPVTVDSPDESKSLDPGEQASFALRVTPLREGSGNLNIVGASENGATASKAVSVVVAKAATSGSASDIAADVDPTSLNTVVGREASVLVHVKNNGDVAESISLAAEGAGVDVSPPSQELVLGPGESATREFTVTPYQTGQSTIQVKMQTARGASLQPVVLVDADEAQDQSSDDGSDSGPGPAKPSRGSSPALEVPIIVCALAALVALARRRMK